MSQAKVEINKIGNDLNVKLSGVVNEDFSAKTHSLDGALKINLDLNEVNGINSCGIREWIEWLSSVPKTEIQLFNCPKCIVEQFNMIHGFLPSNAKVESFFVPYYSDETESEKNILFRRGLEFKIDKDFSLHPPTNILDEKGLPMEMDVIESKYFKFLKQSIKS